MYLSPYANRVLGRRLVKPEMYAAPKDENQYVFPQTGFPTQQVQPATMVAGQTQPPQGGGFQQAGFAPVQGQTQQGWQGNPLLQAGAQLGANYLTNAGTSLGTDWLQPHIDSWFANATAPTTANGVTTASDGLFGVGGEASIMTGAPSASNAAALTSAADIGYGAGIGATAPYTVGGTTYASGGLFGAGGGASVGAGTAGGTAGSTAAGGGAAGGGAAAGAGAAAAIAAMYLYGSHASRQNAEKNVGVLLSYGDGELQDAKNVSVNPGDVSLFQNYLDPLLQGAIDNSGLYGRASGSIGRVQSRATSTAGTPYVVKTSGGKDYGRYANEADAIGGFLQMNQENGDLEGTLDLDSLTAYRESAYKETGLADLFLDAYKPELSQNLMGDLSTGNAQIDPRLDLSSYGDLHTAFINGPGSPLEQMEPFHLMDYYGLNLADTAYAEQQYHPYQALVQNGVEVGNILDGSAQEMATSQPSDQNNGMTLDKALYLLNPFDPGP